MPRRSLSGETTVIDFDMPQSVVIFGDAGILRDDPDFIPAMLMDYILGGGSLGTRLTDEMREKRGLTYGVYTYLASGNFGGLYMGSFSVRTSGSPRPSQSCVPNGSAWPSTA